MITENSAVYFVEEDGILSKRRLFACGPSKSTPKNSLCQLSFDISCYL